MKISLLIFLTIIVIGVILLFSPIPHVVTADAQCQPCSSNLLPSQCPKCPRKGDIEWESSLVYIWYQSINRKDHPGYTTGPMSSDVIRTTDFSNLQNQKFSSPDDLLITAVGNSYFNQHFRKVYQQENFDFIKAAYTFSYPPNIQDLNMILLFDNSSQTISTKERSQILLSPQEFRISADQALSQAVKLGLISCQSYLNNAEFDLVNNRLVWRINRGMGCPELTSKNQGVIISTAIDVETGQTYLLERNEPGQTF